jgi:hypothetical protein
MLDQEIVLEAALSNGRLVAKRLDARRARAISGALTGQPLDRVAQHLANLYPLCGTAHALAGLGAIEDALDIEISPAQTAFRNLILLAEHAASVAWRLLMDWPPLIGDAPDVRACAAIRRTVGAASAIAESWTRIAGTTLRVTRLGTSIDMLATQLTALFPEAALASTWPTFERTLADGSSLPARLIKAARAMPDYGRHPQPLLTSRDAAWFVRRLRADPHFGEAPTLDGTPAEVGPLAAQRHPLVNEAMTQWGPTLATRLLAAALDAPALATRLRSARQALADDDPTTYDTMSPGRGTSVVETARGALAYEVDVGDGVVRSLRSVAPTEWNFHPRGPFAMALASAPPVADPLFAARLLAASFDPCVPFRIALAQDRPTAADIEAVCHA